MPAGMPYFAWIEPGETTFEAGHLRWDESIFSFTLAQSEGDPASLTIAVRRPRNEAGAPIGLLGPGRKIWAWFALDCGDDDLIKFRGRLVGVPTSLFEDLVTLEFVARPIDLVAQKEALAETLRVLPYYDEIMLDPKRRTDPEVVLEGYSAIWHYDRESHQLSISDEITGEDGLVEFDGASEGGKVLWDGLGLTLTSGPLARVDVVDAEFTWTQLGQGTVDLTQYIIQNWPGHGPNYVASHTFDAGSWPKTGASLGAGWKVAEASAFTPEAKVYTHSVTTKATNKFPDSSWFGASSSTTTSSHNLTNFSPVNPFEGPITHWIIDGRPGSPYASPIAGSKFTDSYTGNFRTGSYSYSSSQTTNYLMAKHTIATLIAGYEAHRQCSELVSFSLLADVQHVLTDPEDGEALRIDNITSVNLSEMIGEGSDAYIPIGDTRRRSYVATERGNRSLEHLIALARAHLLKRSRVVEIAFAPKLARMPEITLRKNVFLVEPRVGEAIGKVIGYSIALNGEDGRVACEVRIGCAIGKGGTAVAEGGDPTYCSADYTGADYQQFTDRIVLFDTSVGYQPPGANPNDDGLNLLSPLKVADVIEIPLVVENPIDEQYAHFVNALPENVGEIGRLHETRATFKLKSMTREFSSVYALQVTDLKIPTGYDLSMT